MLRHVRLPLLEPAYFVETVETDELIRRCVDAFPVLQEARCYHLLGGVVRTPSSNTLHLAAAFIQNDKYINYIN